MLSSGEGCNYCLTISTSKLMFPFESVAMIAYSFRQVNPSDASGQPESGRDERLGIIWSKYN